MKPAEFIRPPIKQLSDQLANQIAAGEVVERPASIVKELIENSLDAGATTIELEIVKGGFELIKIRDNGCGIPKEELILAVQAHCTSKISSFDDLVAIESMGFRGEALASIVSVSRFEITSMPQSQAMAWTWCEDELIPASHPIGTSISVRDIFYNTMARRKFLRSERTEFRHIEDVVKRIALSRFDVDIILKHNQRVVYRLNSATNLDLKIKRLEKLLDKKFVNHAIEVSYQSSGLSITGWLSNKDYSRGQSDMQYFYVNGRMVKDKVINHALRQVYQAVLPPGRFPAYILNLQIDAQQVDVNVHPTKHEVRFREMRLVHDFVNHVIKDSLAKVNSEINNNNEKVYSFSESTNVSHSNLNEPTVFREKYHGDLEPKEKEPKKSNDYQNVESVNHKSLTKNTPLLGYAVGFCEPNYLICHSQQGMVVVHLQRAAQHSVEIQWSEEFKLKEIKVKPFIFPISIQLDFQLCESIDKHQTIIQSLGFDLSLQSSDTILLRSVPDFLQDCNHEGLVKQLLTSLQMEKGITEVELIQLLSRFVVLDNNSETKSLDEWNHYLRLLEYTFASLCNDSPYKNKLWRIMSDTEVNKLFQTNVSFDLHSNN